jgi:cell division transport system permease protein
MKPRVWVYFFKTAVLNIFNDRLIHLISMGTITIAMLLFGSFLLLYVNLDSWIKEWGESISMSVYLKDGIDDRTKQAVEQALRKMKRAEVKGYISKKQAMKNLIEGLGEQAGLLSNLKENPLPASFEIIFKDVKDYHVDPKKIKEDLERIEGVDEVQYSEQWIDRFEGVMFVFKIVGLIIGGLLCIAVLFITTNTIKLTIYSRRDEIDIYKLVGATDWFIKIPFLIEGAIQGIVSGVIAFLILLLAYWLFSINTVYLFGLPILDITFLSTQYALSIILLSVTLGSIGGLIAVGRFFKR